MSVLTLCCLECTSLSICLSSQQTNCKQSTGRAMSSLHSQGLGWSLDGGHGSGDAEKGVGVRRGVTGTYICVHAWCLSRGHLLLTLSWKTLRNFRNRTQLQEKARVKENNVLQSTWEELFTAVDSWIYLSVSWMKGGNALACVFCIVQKKNPLESDWKEKFFLALSSRRNLSSECLYNRHEVTQGAASPTGFLQKDTDVLRRAILLLSAARRQKGFLRENETAWPPSRAFPMSVEVLRIQKERKVGMSPFNRRSQRPHLDWS